MARDVMCVVNPRAGTLVSVLLVLMTLATVDQLDPAIMKQKERTCSPRHDRNQTHACGVPTSRLVSTRVHLSCTEALP